MGVIIAAELQSDLERLYKIAGDLLNEIEMKEVENCPLSAQSAREMLEVVKFRLEDMAGTLQKDIFNLGFLKQ